MTIPCGHGVGRYNQGQDADDQHLGRNLDPNVLQRSRAASLSRAIWRIREATIDLGTLEVSQGQLPGRALGLVQDGRSYIKEELLEDWRLCRENTLPAKISRCSEAMTFMYWDDLAPGAMYAQVAGQGRKPALKPAANMQSGF